MPTPMKKRKEAHPRLPVRQLDARYPLQIYATHEIEEGSSSTVLEYVSRGHHSPEAFAAALLRDYDVTAPTDLVQQAWWRTVPAPTEEDPKGTMYVNAKGPGTGVFPVTKVDAWDVRQREKMTQMDRRKKSVTKVR